ncbi:MAG TPA: DUF1223 domain-containing protein, partial [Gemmataceae bacterium]|nr:DUF1223 domain-containing protein [Gemmataceae bacterium]
MLRRMWALLGGVLLAGTLALSGFARMDDKPGDKPVDKPGDKPAEKAPAGTWKLFLPLQSADPWWLVRFESKENAWSGKIVASGEEVPRSQLSNVQLKDGVLQFAIKAGDARLDFSIRVTSPDAVKLMGSVGIRSNIQAVELERTTLDSIDKTELNKEIVANSKDNIAVMKAAGGLIGRAGFLKAKPEQVRLWMDRALKAAEPYGERLQLDLLLQLVTALNEQDGMANVTLPYARRAERLLTPKDRPAVRKQALELLAAALERAGKEDEAREVSARAKKIDFTIATQPYPPRTGKNNRVVVVELFTGTECPPCVAADLAFDALNKTFKPSEAILLQYHEHIPGPDPLTNDDTQARMKYYSEAFAREVRGTPSTLFNGNPAAGGGGTRAEAQDKYDQFFKVITDQLDKPANVNLKLNAVRKGDKVDITAEVADLKDTGESVRLRLVLIEELVEYKGSNGIGEHHHVVRAFPGGINGKPLKEKTAKQTVSVDLGELRNQLKKSLQESYKKLEEELPKDVPMELKKLRVVALIQDDNTRDILHAVQVD